MPPLIDGHVDDAALRDDARVVDEPVDLAEPILDRLDHGVDLFGLSQIGSKRFGGPAPRAHRLDCGLGTTGFLAIADRHVGTRIGAGHVDGGADATTGTRHQDDLVGEGVVGKHGTRHSDTSMVATESRR